MDEWIMDIHQKNIGYSNKFPKNDPPPPPPHTHTLNTDNYMEMGVISRLSLPTDNRSIVYRQLSFCFACDVVMRQMNCLSVCH